MTSAGWEIRARSSLRISILLLLLAVVVPSLHGQSDEDFDSYKARISAFLFYSNPSGSIQGSHDPSSIDFQRDLGFSSYATFTGKLDWKFTRKNHFYLVGSNYGHSRQRVLQRTIVFQGQTFDVNTSEEADINVPEIAPGYQYDIMRRRRGHLGVGVQLDLFNVAGTIKTTTQVTGQGVHQAEAVAKGSVLATIPVAGPDFRFYLTNSPRLFVEGQLNGMYFFGYGDFISTADGLGFTVSKHLSLNAGYQLGSRLVVRNSPSNNRIGLRLTQSGAVVGVEASF